MRIREPLVNIDLIMSLPLHPVYEQLKYKTLVAWNRIKKL